MRLGKIQFFCEDDLCRECFFSRAEIVDKGTVRAFEVPEGWVYRASVYGKHTGILDNSCQYFCPSHRKAAEAT